MAITKILNIMESEGRNPASHLKNALEYIQNPDKTEECVLVGLSLIHIFEHSGMDNMAKLVIYMGSNYSNIASAYCNKTIFAIWKKVKISATIY